MLETITEGLAKILQHIWQALFAMPGDAMLDFLGHIFGTAADFWSDKLGDVLLEFSKSITPPDTMTPELKQTIDELLKGGTLGSIISALFYLIPWSFGYMLNTWSILHQDALRQAASTYTPSLPDLATLIPLLWRHPDKEAEIKKVFGWLGFDADQMDNVFKAAKPTLDIEELRRLRLRGEISPGEFLEAIKKHGYNDKEAENIESLSWFIPPVQDLITMAVREAFSPDIAERFGQFEGFPPDFANFAKMQGVSEQWAKYYWAAHWSLPSVQMGYEMMHRDVIGNEDLDKLMKALDIMPFWREKLKQISYKPYTRVDVRRMHLMGILDEKAVLRAYKDLGYDDEKAENMTKFTLMYNQGREKDLTKSEVLDMMKKDIMSSKQVETYLIELGYDEIETANLIKRALWKKEQDDKELSLSLIKQMYVHNVYTSNEAIMELGKLHMTGVAQQNLLALWDKIKQSKIKDLSANQLKELIIGRIITPDQYKEEMLSIGYTEKHVDWLVKLYSTE